MSRKKILQALLNYRKARTSQRQKYLDAFEKKMIYRTTKTENPQTTKKMVENVINKLKSK